MSEDGSMSVSEEKLLIVIPAYNEAGRVGAVIADVRHTLPEADVLVIDDGSEDATSAEARQGGRARAVAAGQLRLRDRASDRLQVRGSPRL